MGEKSRPWPLIIILIVVAAACPITCLIVGFISSHNDELVEYKKATGSKCWSCSQIFAPETTAAKMKRSDLKGRKILADYRDTLCGACILKLAPVAESFFKDGQKAFNSKDYDAAWENFNKADSLGHEQALTWRIKTNDKLGKIALSDVEKLSTLKRKEYVETLRNHFLDKNMDVKVWVTGKGNKYLHMKFILFNDVWVHNFRKGDLIGEIRQLGFERVYFTDGYDYNYYVYWEDKEK